MEDDSTQNLDALTVIFDQESRSLVKLALENEEHRVFESGDYLQATTKLSAGLNPDVVFVEYRKAPFDALGFRRLLRCTLNSRVVLIAGGADQALHKEAWDLGIRHFLTKPFLPSAVRQIIADLRRVNKGESSAIQRDDSAWWAIYTFFRHEKSVARMLQTKKFDVFLPLCQSLRRWTDRQKLLSLPVFPGYVFVRGGLNRRLEVVTTPGVQTILFYGEQVAIIPDVEIRAIQKMLDGHYHAEPHPYLKCGERVRVKRGSLEGIEGILVRKKNDFRLILSVDLLARSVAVEIDAADLEPIDSRADIPRFHAGQLADIGLPEVQSFRTEQRSTQTQ